LLDAGQAIRSVVGVGGHGGGRHVLRDRHRDPAVRPGSATTGIAHGVVRVGVALP
jgi:hypothetical protein